MRDVQALCFAESDDQEKDHVIRQDQYSCSVDEEKELDGVDGEMAVLVNFVREEG